MPSNGWAQGRSHNAPLVTTRQAVRLSKNRLPVLKPGPRMAVARSTRTGLKARILRPSCGPVGYSLESTDGDPSTFPRAASMKRLVTAITLLAMLPLAEIPGQHAPRSYVEARDYTRWEKEVAAYEVAARQNPPPKDGILFIGSSTIRLWKT